MSVFNVRVRVSTYEGYHGVGAAWLAKLGEGVRRYFDQAQHNGLPRTYEIHLVPGFSLSGETAYGLSNSQLAEDHRQILQNRGEARWQIDLFLGQWHDSTTRTFGMMFDPYRRACAAFVRAIQKGFKSDYHWEVLCRTVAHELGHCLNLCHPMQQDCLMSPGRPTYEGLETANVSEESRLHLQYHAASSVMPGSNIAFGYCETPHPGSICTAENKYSRGRSGQVHLDLRVHRGAAYPRTRGPTLVIGEPLHVTLRLMNQSRRAVYFPKNPTTVNQSLMLYRIDGEAALPLHAPLLRCDADPADSWRRVPPGGSATLSESLVYRRGDLVFPCEGKFGIAARLWIRNRWINSPVRRVNVLPPEKRRHATSIELARTPEVGLFLETGGGAHLHSGFETLRRLLAYNRRFPLNGLARLVFGRQAVFDGRSPYRTWRHSLRTLCNDARQPTFLRREAGLLLQVDRARCWNLAANARRRLEEKIPIVSARRFQCRSAGRSQGGEK